MKNSTKDKKEQTLLNKNILVVEDDIFISKVYAKWLQLYGANVFHSTDGALALLEIEKHVIDLVLLDLGMPGLDGYRTLEQLQKNMLTKNIPVIILSNTTIDKGSSTFEEVKASGVFAVLRKYETSLEELVSAIENCFAKESKNIKNNSNYSQYGK